jgi:hypothetical protein
MYPNASSANCTTCEAQLTAPPTLHDGQPFCCSGCAAGGPCMCTYDAMQGDPRTIRHCRDITTFDDEAVGALRRGSHVGGG